MSLTPTDVLAGYWRTLDAFDDVNLLPAPDSKQIVAPSVVLRPDSPWSTPSDGGAFCFDHQRYVAVVVASAASSVDAMRRIYRIWQTIITNLPSEWRFDRVDGLVLDQSTGTAFLAAQVHLSYFNSEALEDS